MRVLSGMVATLLGLSMILSPVAAQGPPLDAANNTIWNQYTTEGGCCTTFGSTMKDDPRFAGSGNFGSLYVLPAGTATTFVLAYALTPEEFAMPVILDPDGTVDFTVNLGAGISQGGAVGVAVVDVDVALTVGDTVVASGSGESIEDTAADGYKTVTYSVAPEVTRLDPADGEIEWSITISGAASGIYVSHTDANGNAWVTLPIIGVEGGPGAGPETIVEDLDAPMVAHHFANATSDTYVLNFTNDFEDVVASFAWNATNGTVDVVLNGPDGMLFEGLFEGTASQEEVFEGVATGPWNLSVTYTDFAGSFDFSLQEPAEGGGAAGGDGADGGDGSDGGDAGDGGDGAGNGNATGNETLDSGADGKDSPAPALPVLALGIVAAVATMRRRG